MVKEKEFFKKGEDKDMVNVPLLVGVFVFIMVSSCLATVWWHVNGSSN